MSKLRITYILPSDMGDEWKKCTPPKTYYLPHLNDTVHLTNRNNDTQPFLVVGLKSWSRRFLFWCFEYVDIRCIKQVVL